MQHSTFLLILSPTSGAIADLYIYANCYSHIQPIGNPKTCNKKHDFRIQDRGFLMERSYADNAAATTKTCQEYKNRNTGTNQLDTCPDCTLGQRGTSDPTYCVLACNLAAKHIGGDEWNYYCKQNEADGSDAY